MVFCGKPSTGCTLCRSRKIKCDETKPSCRQCLKSHRTCPGYRDIQTLMFRDESERVSKKVQLRNQSSSSSERESQTSSPPASKTSSNGTSPQSSDSSLALSLLPVAAKPLSVPIGEQGHCYFFTNYVMGEAGGHLGYLNHLPSLSLQESSHGPLAAALRSVGLAGLANVRSSPAVMTKARTQYASALTLINAALRDPAQVKTDSTLTTVILLSMFETITCTSPNSMRSWNNHIDGATALLKLRGTDQLQENAGFWMFIYLRNQIVTSCLQRNLQVPPVLVKMANMRGSMTKTFIQGNNLVEAIIDFCEVRAKIAAGSIEDPVLLFSLLSGIELKLAAWAASAPPEWTYSTIPITGPSSEVCDDEYHVYPTLWSALAWNNYRSVRIIANELLLGHLSKYANDASSPFSNADYTAQRGYLKESMAQLSSDICAGVPYFLNYFKIRAGGSPDSPAASSPSSASFSDFSFAETPSAAGMFCLWPLYLVGSMVGATLHRRRWAISRLRYVGHNMGIQQAHAFASRLEEAEEWRADHPDVSNVPALDKRDEYWPLEPDDEHDSPSAEDYSSAKYHESHDENGILLDHQHDDDDEESSPGETWKKYIGRPGKYAFV